MSRDSSTDGLNKARPVLGDLTNRPLKRRFSEILSDSGLKSTDGYAKNFETETEDSQLAKQIRSDVEKSQRETSVGPSEIECGQKGSSALKEKQPCGSSSTSAETNPSQENTESLVSKTTREFRSNVLEDCVHQNIIEGGDASRDSSFSSVPTETWSDLWDSAFCRRFEESRRASDATSTQSKPVEGPSVAVCKDGKEGIAFGGLFSKKPLEWSKLPKQSSQSHEFGRCTILNDAADVGNDVLKACSCSFCMKAAYIWSDLQYQDIKGRLSALKKSKKEASSLAQRNSRGKEADLRGQGNETRSSKLESDLSGQWKSLFCHMEDVFGNESNQLQASFLTLKELRENCKTALETINGMPPQKH